MDAAAAIKRFTDLLLEPETQAAFRLVEQAADAGDPLARKIMFSRASLSEIKAFLAN